MSPYARFGGVSAISARMVIPAGVPMEISSGAVALETGIEPNQTPTTIRETLTRNVCGK